MLKVGLTGGIGSGKSTASLYLETLGACVFDADKEAKKLIYKDETVQHELISEFGTDIIDANDQIDKSKLSRVAFQDQDHQERLNAVVHPHIFDKLDKFFNQAIDKKKYNIFIVDAALVYESGLDTHLDYIIVVTAQLQNRMERSLARNTLSREEILKRIEFQWAEEEKVNMADFVIHNDRDEKTLKNNLKNILDKLI